MSERSDERLDRAIRGALADVVAAAPRGADALHGAGPPPAGGGKRPWLALAAASLAAVGVVAIVAVMLRPTFTTEIAERSLPSSTSGTTSPTTAAQSTTASPTTAGPTTTVAPTRGPLQRVEFQRGTNNRAVAGDLDRGTSDRYVLEAAAGQTMIVFVDSDAPGISFSVVAPDGTTLAAGEELTAVDLPADGDYVVEVVTTGDGGAYEINFLID